YSFVVKASIWPPTESTMSAMSWALRVSVPLNRRCSMKWEMPFCCGVSWREPRFIQTPRATERRLRIGSVIRTKPFPKISLRISSMALMVTPGRRPSAPRPPGPTGSFPGGLDVLSVFEVVDRGRVGRGLPGRLIIRAAGDPELDEARRAVALLDLPPGVLENRPVGMIHALGDDLHDLEMPSLPGHDDLVLAVTVHVLQAEVAEGVALLGGADQGVLSRSLLLVDAQLRLAAGDVDHHPNVRSLRVEAAEEDDSIPPFQGPAEKGQDGIVRTPGAGGEGDKERGHCTGRPSSGGRADQPETTGGDHGRPPRR